MAWWKSNNNRGYSSVTDMLQTKEQPKQVEVMELSPELPKKSMQEIIQEIHDAYDNSCEQTLIWAKDILANTDTEAVKKGERLLSLGFKGSEKAVKAKKEIEARKQAEEKAALVNYYKINYPFNKFITKDQVSEINNKYGLVCVTADCYKADIPEKNLQDIENFKAREEDKVYSVTETDVWNKSSFTKNFVPKEEINFKDNCIEAEIEPFYISCPPHEAEIKRGYSTKSDTFVSKDPVEDPIVLQPVKGGFLIVTKWGLEAEDPMLQNETLN